MEGGSTARPRKFSKLIGLITLALVLTVFVAFPSKDVLVPPLDVAFRGTGELESGGYTACCDKGGQRLDEPTPVSCRSRIDPHDVAICLLN